MREVFLLLIPCAALTLVLAVPITRLVYQRGAFNAVVDRRGLDGAALVLVLAAVLGREPAAHPHVLQPAAPVALTRLSGIVLVLNVAVSIALAGRSGSRGS